VGGAFFGCEFDQDYRVVEEIDRAAEDEVSDDEEAAAYRFLEQRRTEGYQDADARCSAT